MSQITTHILDISLGLPARGVATKLEQHVDDEWRELASGITNEDGRVANLLATGEPLHAGVYRMHFDTGSYFAAQELDAFYPWVDIVFNIASGGEHYHVPLLLSPFGYSTYRGS